MTTEQSSPESPTRKRPRRSKQDPQFIFDNPTINDTGANATSASANKRSPTKKKTKSLLPVESADASADLYEPGDIVWCKLGGFPWWPALIYRCNAEGGIHTKTLNSNNKPKRLFFVYFYGKYLEYSWISTRWLLKYAGLSNFIEHAEAAVQKAETKSEQQELANRYQLKVSMKKRVQWDEAIELADRAMTMTNSERIEEFSDLLQDASTQSKSARRRKTSADKSQTEEEDESTKKRIRGSSASSAHSAHEINEQSNTNEKPHITVRKPKQFSENDLTADEKTSTNKRSRKRKSEGQNDTLSNSIDATSNEDQSMKTRRRTASPDKERSSSKKSTRKSKQSTAKKAIEVEYDMAPESNRNDEQASSPKVHLIQANTPPLSNYEQKLIVEGLLQHPKEQNLSFEEAQTFATNKAIEIVFENHNYRMTNIAPEWFYESILLKYPSVVFKYRSWFQDVATEVIPNGGDMIKLKQWQIALMLHAQIQAEQKQQQQDQQPQV